MSTTAAATPPAPQPQGGQGSTEAALARLEERDKATATEIALLRDDFKRLESRLWALAGASVIGAGAVQAAVQALGGG